MNSPLTRIVPWAHQLVREVLRPGDLAVDLTAGTGQDTLLLFETVGSHGQVLAFDIQPQALENTRARLEPLGARVKALPTGTPLPDEAGVYLLAAGHEQLETHLSRAPRVVIANLGFLPGGDGHIITRPETTLTALDQAARLLAPGGRLAVVVYTGHPGGAEEGVAVEHYFCTLPADGWQTIRVETCNRHDAPFLLAAQKSS